MDTATLSSRAQGEVVVSLVGEVVEAQSTEQGAGKVIRGLKVNKTRTSGPEGDVGRCRPRI